MLDHEMLCRTGLLQERSLWVVLRLRMREHTAEKWRIGFPARHPGVMRSYLVYPICIQLSARPTLDRSCFVHLR